MLSSLELCISDGYPDLDSALHAQKELLGDILGLSLEG